MIQNLTLQMTGTMPLIMHNVQAADPMNVWAKAMKEITAKKTNKTDSDDMELSRLKFLSSLYFDEELGPYLPSANIFRCLIEAGAMTRDGKNVERGVSIQTDRAPLAYDGPRTQEALWGDGSGLFVDRRLAAVNRVRIPVVRPIFPSWVASFEVAIEDEVLDVGKFETLAAKAGQMVGVGDYRRFYGKFSVTIS